MCRATDDTIRRAAYAGETARVCASVLGRTRNSVIGRANRIGVHFNQRNGSRAPQCAVQAVTLPRVGWFGAPTVMLAKQQLAAE